MICTRTGSALQQRARGATLGHVSTLYRRGIVSRPSRTVTVAADKEKDGALSGIVSMGNKVVDQVTDFVPESVPRPMAKTGVTVLGGLIILGLIQKVISGVVTLVVLAGLGYYFLTRGSGDDDVIDVGKSKKDDDLDDPLSEARRIMDKYKK
mmetsp:Transcript_32474/g.71710  ORF Transcript_32474/g.71710 Transcript_32474/m.71710 type:complete len:152 (+) Transcript_32474:69-524(+)